MSGVVQNSAGTTQTKAGVISGASSTRTVSYYTLAADLYKADAYSNNAPPGSGQPLDEKQLLARAGQEVSSDDLTRWFAAATFTSMTPATGLAAGGTSVVIKGTNLRGVAHVTFGGTNEASITYNSETQITVTTPAKSAGTYAVLLKDDAGDVSAGNFVYS